MAAGSRGLGKGLDSMIPKKVVVEKKTDSVKLEKDVSRETLININQIEPNKLQPRKAFNEDTLQELADSIKLYGIIQPLILQKRDKYYEIIAGERRWRAAKVAGLKEVPAIVKEYSSQEIVEIALIENIQREDLNPIEEAIAFQKLIVEFKLKQDEVAERVSKSRAAIANSMRLLKLDQRVQQMLIDAYKSQGLSEEDAKKLLKDNFYFATMMVELGVRLHFAAGSDKNIKLTTKDDLEMFKGYLSRDKESWLK